jgi:hypothetical protein
LLVYAAEPTRAPPPDARVRWAPPILVCIAPTPASLDPAVADEMRATLPRAAEVWNKVTDAGIRVLFAGENGVCRIADGRTLSQVKFTEPGKHVARARLIPGLSALAASETLGNELAANGQLRFPTDYPANDAVCGDRGSAGAARCRFGDAVHEFGHLLGFRHDHVSAAAPGCTDLRMSGERTDPAMSYYDAASVMNYCNAARWTGELSPADICSVQVAYPPRANRVRDERECYRLASRALAG